MDIDKDGRKDIVVGSFGGQIFWLKGTEKGFLKEDTLKNVKGKDLTLTKFYDHVIDKYSEHKAQPFAKKDISKQTAGDRAEAARILDWNQDGKLDLLMIGSGGGLYLNLQQQSKKAPAFSEKNQVLRDKNGTPMIIAGSHPAVSLFDWDGDGLKDIVFALKKDLCWHRNVGSKKKPSYAPFEAVVKGSMPKVTGIEFYDVDKDGTKDLVTGNYNGELLWYKRKKLSQK